MENQKTDDDRVADQVSQLLRLQQRSYSLSFLCRLAGERRETVTERGVEEPMERVAVELLDPLTGDGDPVPVVRGELLASLHGDGRDARLVDLLGRSGLRRGDDECEGVLRFVPSRNDVRPDLRSALRTAEEAGLRASAHHVVALAGRMKGQSTPEYTDEPLGFLEVGTQESGDRVPVVVIDTGIAREAEARKDGWLDGVRPLSRRDIDPLDLVDIRGDLSPDGLLDRGAGHGTFVAGVVRQVDPTADVRVLRALDTDGVGSECSISRAIRQAAAFFAEHGGRGVLNLSLGMETVDGLAPLAIETALETLPPDVIVVAAAGNSGTSTLTWPAASKRVLGVAGLDRHLQPTRWSNRGHWVDFSTVGEGVVSTFVNGTETGATADPHDPGDDDPETFPRTGQRESYALWTGTSFAAPRVAAWLARHLTDNPGARAEEAEAALRARGTRTKAFGYAVHIPNGVV